MVTCVVVLCFNEFFSDKFRQVEFRQVMSLFVTPANSLIISLLIAFKDNRIRREIIKE